MITHRYFRTMVAACVCMTLQSDAVRGDQGYSIESDMIYGRKAGMALTLDIVRPNKDANGIGLLYMVSRGFVSNYFDLDKAMATSERRNGRFSSLTDRGYTLFIVRHGSAPFFKVPDAVADVTLALRYIRFHADRLRVDADRLGVFGNSAGGHLALMLGTTSDDGQSDATDEIQKTPAHVAAVVAYYPPVDLRQTQFDADTVAKLRKGPLDFDKDLQSSVSPIVHVSPNDPPTLLIHGDKDALVPLSNSQRIHAAFKKAGVDSELIIMKGAGHAFPGEYGSRAADALADWFDKYLVRSQE